MLFRVWIILVVFNAFLGHSLGIRERPDRTAVRNSNTADDRGAGHDGSFDEVASNTGDRRIVNYRRNIQAPTDDDYRSYNRREHQRTRANRNAVNRRSHNNRHNHHHTSHHQHHHHHHQQHHNHHGPDDDNTPRGHGRSPRPVSPSPQPTSPPPASPPTGGLEEPNLITPTEYVSPDNSTILSNWTLVVSNTATFIDCTSTSLTVTKEDAMGVAAGSVLTGVLDTSDAPSSCNQILRKVTKVVKGSGGQVILKTAPATVFDVFDKASLTVDNIGDLLAGGDAASSSDGRRRLAADWASGSIKLGNTEVQYSASGNAGIKLKPIHELSLDFGFKLEWEAEWGWPLPDLRKIRVKKATVYGKAALEVGLQMTAYLNSQYSASVQPQDLLAKNKRPWGKPIPFTLPVPIPGTPVTLPIPMLYAAEPVAVFSANATLKQSLNVMAKFTSQASASFEAGYIDGRGLIADKTFSPFSSPKVDHQVNASCSGAVTASLTIGARHVIATNFFNELILKWEPDNSKQVIAMVTLPSIKATATASVNMPVPGNAIHGTDGSADLPCNTCNKYCPSLGLLISPDITAGLKVEAGGLIKEALKAVKFDTEKSFNLPSLKLPNYKKCLTKNDLPELLLKGAQTMCCAGALDASNAGQCPGGVPLKAVDDAFQMGSGETKKYDVIANDIVPAGARATIKSIDSSPAHGTASIGADKRTIVFKADAQISSRVQTDFRITVTDGSTTSSSKVTVTITAAPVPGCNQDLAISPVLTGSETCEDACKRAPPTSCKWRPINGGSTSTDECLIPVTLAGGKTYLVAGRRTKTSTASQAPCMLGNSTSSVDSFGAIAQPTSAQQQQRCVCITCVGADCDKKFWAAAGSTCSGPAPSVPSGAPALYWGQWCRRTTSGTLYGEVGYVRDGTCYTFSGSTTSYSKWCKTA